MYVLFGVARMVFYDHITGCLRHPCFVPLDKITIEMKHISVLVPAGNSIVDTVIAPFNLLNMAIRRQGVSRRFRIDLVGLTKDPVVYQSLFSIRPTASINEIHQTDLIIISPISGDLNAAIELNIEFVHWIRKQRIENGTELASLCKGAFLLAETGLVKWKTVRYSLDKSRPV